MPFFAWLMFRLTSHWKQFRISGSSRIGNDLPVQAHPAMDNSARCGGSRVATKLGWSWRTTGRRCWDSRAIGSISRRSTKSTSSSSCGSGASGGIAACPVRAAEDGCTRCTRCMNERSGICRALSIKPRWWWNCIGWIARRAEGRRRRCRSCPARRPTANGLRTRWGSPVRVPRRGRWRGGWVWHRAVRGIDLRYLERCEASRRKPPLRHMGVDELYQGKRDKFLTVVCNLETAEPLWFGKERKKETLDEYFRTELTSRQRKGIEAVCVDMWEPFRLSLEQWVPGGKIIYDKFHVLGHANDAVDEVRRAEFFRQGREKRELIKGKKWLLLSRWKNLNGEHRGDLNELFWMNRRVFKAYLLKESLEGLWDYKYPGAMLNYLGRWMDRLKWQRLAPFEELADMLLKHLEGIVNYCRTKVRFGVV